MSRYERTVVMILTAVIINVCLLIFGFVYVFAEETDTEISMQNSETEVVKTETVDTDAGTDIRSMDSDIYIGDEKIQHTSDEIYYTNKQVDIILQKENKTEDDEVNNILNELKSQYPGETLEVKKDEYISVSIYDGEKFLDYTEMEDGKYSLTPGESDEYNRNVLRFKKILSYKIFRNMESIIQDQSGNDSERENSPDNADNKEIEKLIEYVLETPVYQFIFDKSAPQIYAVRSHDGGSSLNVGHGENLGNVNAGQQVDFKMTDMTGLAKVCILRNGNTIDNIELSGDERIIEYNYELILSKENSGADEIKVIATDLAGNISEYYFDYNIDVTPPEITVSGAEDGNVYGGVSLTISAKDESGGANIYYKCVYTNAEGEATCLENLTSTDGSPIVRNYTEEGVYDIATFAYDSSGNYSGIIRKSFGIDAHAPALSLENVINNGVYNDNVSLYAVLSELFYDGVNTSVECNVTDVNGVRNVSLSPFEIGARVNKNIYTFADEGIYSIKIKASDRTGHETSAELHFTIDRSAPEIDVSADAGVKDIYNNDPGIRVEARDSYTEYESFMTLIRKNKDGSYTEEDSSKIVSIGKNTDVCVPVTGEGEYVLKIILRDEAGNISEKNIEFTVDKTPPAISYLSNYNEKYIKSFSLPKVSDIIDDMTGVIYNAYLNSDEVSSCEITKDGKYIIQIVAVDEAGNRSEETAAFIVDATLPKVIVKGIDTKGEVGLNETVDLTLFDSDDYFESAFVNGKEISITGNRRQLSVPVSEYGDYEIEVCAMDYAGNETHQIIKASCIFKANPFEIKLDSSDIKTLTKIEPEIREKFFWNFSNRKFVILCVSMGVLALIIGVSVFVDIKFLKCDTITRK